MTYKYTLTMPDELRIAIRRSAATKGQTLGTYLLHTLYAAQGMRVPLPAEFTAPAVNAPHRSIVSIVEEAEEADLDTIETQEDRKSRLLKEWEGME